MGKSAELSLRQVSLPLRSDWLLIVIYWIIAAPIIFLSNMDAHGAEATSKALLFTIILDTATVLTIMFTLPAFVIKQHYMNASVFGFFLLMFFGLIYSFGYNILFKEPFVLNIWGLLKGMVSHARSYGILAMLASGKRFYDLRLHMERVERFKAENELKFIRSQINPHFLFNTLNNIYSLVIDNVKASSIINQLSDLLRYTVYEANKDWVLLVNELKFIVDYYNLEKVRHDNYPAITLNVSGEPKTLKIAPSILIIFVENAFKHGFQAGSLNSWVKIEILIQDEILQLTVHNSKSSDLKTRHSTECNNGIGLQNAKRHLELLYPTKHQLEIEDGSNTFRVNLILELL